MKKTCSMAAWLLVTLVAGCAAKQPDAAQVSLDEAKAVALSAEGVEDADVEFAVAELEEKAGCPYYEVDFTDGSGLYYHYAVDAVTGTVIESGLTAEQAQYDGTAQELIREEQAKQIALDDAGVVYIDPEVFQDEQSAEELKDRKPDFTTAVLSAFYYDDGMAFYDVEFLKTQMKASENVQAYDYTIDAVTGEIVNLDHEPEHIVYTNGKLYREVGISEEEACRIALARVPGATEKDIRVALSDDQGQAIYEGILIDQGIEYDFIIDADTGAITEWEEGSAFD